eukprot:scaffold16496_cov56-Phaeocystis_antarctica.AAC.3
MGRTTAHAARVATGGAPPGGCAATARAAIERLAAHHQRARRHVVERAALGGRARTGKLQVRLIRDKVMVNVMVRVRIRPRTRVRVRVRVRLQVRLHAALLDPRRRPLEAAGRQPAERLAEHGLERRVHLERCDGRVRRRRSVQQLGLEPAERLAIVRTEVDKGPVLSAGQRGDRAGEQHRAQTHHGPDSTRSAERKRKPRKSRSDGLPRQRSAK